MYVLVVHTDSYATVDDDVLHNLCTYKYLSYTKTLLKSQLLLMGVKSIHAKRAAAFVFQQIKSTCHNNHKCTGNDCSINVPLLCGELNISCNELRLISNTIFIDMVHDVLMKLKRYTSSYLILWDVCRSISECNTSLILLLSGASGTGKSTLASLLADRLRLTNVISTDTIRHCLRQQCTGDDMQSKLLNCSTYNAYECIGDSTMQHGKRVRKGYKSQSNIVLHSIDNIINNMINTHCSAVVEGVHLMPQRVVDIMIKYSSNRNVVIIPFIIYISNDHKHAERFAIRSKYNTLDALHNRYIESFDNIRCIQKYLLKKADQHLLPSVDNTNIDRSVASIHSMILRSIKHIASHRSLLARDEHNVYRAALMHQQFESAQHDAWSSKQMQIRIKQKLIQKHENQTHIQSDHTADIDPHYSQSDELENKTASPIHMRMRNDSEWTNYTTKLTDTTPLVSNLMNPLTSSPLLSSAQHNHNDNSAASSDDDSDNEIKLVNLSNKLSQSINGTASIASLNSGMGSTVDDETSIGESLIDSVTPNIIYEEDTDSQPDIIDQHTYSYDDSDDGH